MGMAASQVRFLSLQNRKNTIGKQLSALSNRKMSLSRDMNDVSRNYTQALNQINLKWSNDCGKTYHGLSYDMLMKPNDVNTGTPYIITNARNGKVILNDKQLLDQNGNVISTNKAMTFSYSDGTDITVPKDQPVTYMSIAKILTGGCETDADGNVIGGDPNKIGEYYIPNDGDFGFENNLRFQIFEMLGLVSTQQAQQKRNLLVELYGSAEAKERGVYPVGSAWGDYYIAKAKLEAYEAYLMTDQYYCGSSTFYGTANTNESHTDNDGTYTYNTKVYHQSSICTQTVSNSSGAIANVDFSKILDTTNDEYEIISNTDTITTHDNISNKFGQQFKTEVTEDGLKMIYENRDILYNAIENYKAEKNQASMNVTLSSSLKDRTYESLGSTSNDFTIKGIKDINGNQLEYLTTTNFDLISKLTGSDTVICSNAFKSVNRDGSWDLGLQEWEAAAILATAGDDYVSRLCEEFKRLLKYSDISLSDEVFNAALTKITEQKMYTSFKEVKGDNNAQTINIIKGNAEDNVGVYMGGDFNWDKRCVLLAIDVKQLFNTYMSYINDYIQDQNIQTQIAAGSAGGSTNYYISASGKPVKNDAYLNQLEDDVVNAAERIQTLEDNIELFYSNADQKIMDYYDALFLRISEQGWEVDNHTKNDNYLNNKIQNNDFFLTECLQKNATSGFRYTAKQATSISKIFSVHDTNAEQEALVKYETEKNMLQAKENAIDSRMRILETEQQAIKTEMDSIEKVKNDNISKYFKIFA